MPLLDLNPDQLLTTTRAVRKRLDFSREIEPEVLRECIEIATQAPTGGNMQTWHFVVVTDPEKKKQIADLYRQSFYVYLARVSANVPNAGQLDREQVRTMKRVRESSVYLAEHLHEVPVFLIPCMGGRVENLAVEAQAGWWGSILPAVWSFMLAARARGLGTAWTTLHLPYEKEAAQILGIPYDQITQAALIPVAYTIGTEFKPGSRKVLDEIVHVNSW
ncbi:MAG: nitroreductase family protein [Chloroflexi bacterium]|nr:nitroreductase family protein [Chloroflexota bacterium]